MVAPRPLSAVFWSTEARHHHIVVPASDGEGTAGKSPIFGAMFLHFFHQMP